MPRSDRTLRAAGTAAVLCGSVSVQLSSVIATGVFDSYGALGASALRMAVAAALLGAVASPWQELRAHWRGPLLFGLALTGMSVFGYLAIERIPLATSVTLMLLGPLAVALAASRRPSDVAWIVLAAIGAMLVIGSPQAGSWLGIAAALGAAASVASYLLLLRRLGDSWAGLTGLSAGVCCAALLTAPFAVAAAGRTPDFKTGLAAFSLGLLGAFIPYCAEWWATRRLSLRVVGVLLTADPVVAALLGYLFLDQTLSLKQFSGIVCVVFAASATVLSAGATRPLPSPLDVAIETRGVTDQGSTGNS